MADNSLRGRTVVVTRPAHQAEGLCRRIEAAGGQALRFPVIEILPNRGLDASRARKSLEQADLAIFISANAVRFTLKALGPLPPQLRLAAVGGATARALAEAGHASPLLAPPPHDSESLLGLPELQAVRGRHLVILRGGEGRGLLAETLRRRGAEVELFDVYCRRPACREPERLYRAWDGGKLDMFVVTSNEGLQNLWQCVDEAHRARLLATPLVVIGRRTADRAAVLGFTAPVEIADAASDQALLEAACRLTRESR